MCRTAILQLQGPRSSEFVRMGRFPRCGLVGAASRGPWDALSHALQLSCLLGASLWPTWGWFVCEAPGKGSSWHPPRGEPAVPALGPRVSLSGLVCGERWPPRPVPRPRTRGLLQLWHRHLPPARPRGCVFPSGSTAPSPLPTSVPGALGSSTEIFRACVGITRPMTLGLHSSCGGTVREEKPRQSSDPRPEGGSPEEARSRSPREPTGSQRDPTGPPGRAAHCLSSRKRPRQLTSRHRLEPLLRSSAPASGPPHTPSSPS